MKKLLMAVLCLGLALGISGCGSDEGDKDSSKTEEKIEKTYKMNETVKVGDVEYKVLSKKSTKKIGNEYLNKKAQEQYLIIEISIKNLDKEALTVSDDFFKLYNGENEYGTDTDAAIYLDDNIIYEDINPGVTLKGKIVFDIPKEIAESKENILQVQTGVWGTETEKIKLVK